MSLRSGAATLIQLVSPQTLSHVPAPHAPSCCIHHPCLERVCARSKGQKVWNAKTSLTRSEFIEVLIRCAIDDQEVSEMPGCVGELFEDLLNVTNQPHASTILHDGNAFRRAYCYRKEVCAVLEHHEASLRHIFSVYAEEGSGGVDVTGSSKLLGVTEWCAAPALLAYIPISSDLLSASAAYHQPKFCLAFASLVHCAAVLRMGIRMGRWALISDLDLT